MKRLTPEQHQKLADYLSLILGEHFEEYAIVGAMPNGEMLMTHPTLLNPRQKLVLSSLLANALGSVQSAPEPD